MGFDIYAYDDEKKTVAYFRTYMGGFRMMKEQGYDWFQLLRAEDCDGGVSGNGTEKLIRKNALITALYVLKHFEVIELSREGRDEISDCKIDLCVFMDKAIKWCEANDKEEILVYFG